jgi:hypothetical protein
MSPAPPEEPTADPAVVTAARRAARTEDAWLAYSAMYEAFIDAIVAFVRNPTVVSEADFRDAAIAFRAAIRRKDTLTLEHVGELVALRQLAGLNIADILARLDRLEKVEATLETGLGLVEQRMTALIQRFDELSAQVVETLNRLDASGEAAE